MAVRIALSVGHHQDARGASYKDDGGNIYTEYDLANIWVSELAQRFADLFPGMFDVLLVPHGKLGAKVRYINDANVALAVEMHFNACGGKGAGSETLYCPGSAKGKKTAENIQVELAKVFQPDRGVKEGWYKQDRPGVKDYIDDVDGDETPLYFLKKTNCPAVIIEPEFIHKAQDIMEKMDLGCDAIAVGIGNSFTS